jgi:hypothetical protein
MICSICIGHDLQHLHRVGQPMVREPQRGISGVARHAHLFHQQRDLRRDIGIFRPLRIDEKPDLHGGDPLYVTVILGPALNPRKPNATSPA